MIKYMTLIFLSAFLLTGCLTASQAPPSLYVLHPQNVTEEERKSLNASIIVEKPTFAAGLNTDKITVLKNNRRQLDYLAEARWNGELDDVIQDFMIESLGNHFPNLTIHRSPAKYSADYLITAHIDDFQAEYAKDTTASPILKVNMSVSISKLPTLETVFSLRETHQTHAEKNSVSSITSGLEVLMQNMMHDTANEISKALR